MSIAYKEKESEDQASWEEASGQTMDYDDVLCILRRSKRRSSSDHL